MLALLLCLLASPFARADDPCAASPSPSWRSELAFPNDPFQVASGENEPPWVKLTILLCDPTTVYFQDGQQYRFHFGFATNHLPPLAGLDSTAFDQATLDATSQQAVLGAVLVKPAAAGGAPELAIQLLRNEPYTVNEVVQWFTLIRSHINAGPEVHSLYFPTFQQRAAGAAQRQALAEHGIEVSSPDRWLTADACYAPGWAIGRLTMVPADTIDDALRSGALLTSDILLTDGEPRELPPVAGIVSLSPVTPSSHLAILAQTFHTPLVYLGDAGARQRLPTLAGRTVALRTDTGPGGCSADVLDLTGLLTPTQRQELLALKAPRPIELSPLASPGRLVASVDNLVLDDTRHFGGKAAGFGLLRRAVPDHSPRAVAVSFDLWTAFLDQPLPGSDHSLREEINSRLAPFSYPPDLQTLSTTLDGIRDLIRDPAACPLPAAQVSELLTSLQDPAYRFDAETRLRFRSSTNLEDTAHFTGAGLYDSYSGCLADDLDGDETGPSRCDASRTGERGVLRAVRRVFASFYNDNAVLARLRHGVTEDEAGMALLVHHSFPDEIELANGVAVLDTTSPWGQARATIVSQPGAYSVTNPEPAQRPEVVEVDIYDSGSYAYLVDTSNLLLLGQTVLEWDREYLELVGLLRAVADRFEQETGMSSYRLEYELKKVAPAGDLVLKQVRQLPVADTTPSVTPFLAGVPTTFCTFSGEQGELTANHRLKVAMTLATGSFWLTRPNLEQGFWSWATMEQLDGCRVDTWHGPLAQLPGARYELLDGNPTQLWSAPTHPTPRDLGLSLSPFASIGDPVSRDECPIVTLADLGELRLQATYRQPVSGWRHDAPTRTTTMDEAWLAPCLEPSAGDYLQERVLDNGAGLVITTSFTWPFLPSDRKRGPLGQGDVTPQIAGKTAPVVQFLETVISGLTTTPLVLHDQHAQTYHPHHHNFSEDFLFDPWLEPAVSEQQLRELDKLGVRQVVATRLAGGEVLIGLLADQEHCDRLPPPPRRVGGVATH